MRVLTTFPNEVDGEHIIITEYCEGGDLATLMKEYKKENINIPEKQIFKWVIQILLGMQFLQKNKLVNRNLIPESIHFTADGRVKIAQYYLSTIISAKYKAGQLPPTPHMSPEAISGDENTCATDVWSLGALLHNLCCLEVY